MRTKGSASLVAAMLSVLVKSTESVPPSSHLRKRRSYPSPGWLLEPPRNMWPTTVFTWPFLAQKGVLRNLARFLTASVASTNLWTSLDLGLKYTPSLWVPLVTCISPKSVLTSTST